MKLLLFSVAVAVACGGPMNLVPSSEDQCRQECRAAHYETWRAVDACLARCDPPDTGAGAP